MSNVANPISDTYDAIYKQFAENDAFIDYMELTAHPGRFPNYNPAGKTYQPDPMPQGLNPADYPYARLVFLPQRRFYREQGPRIQQDSDGSYLTAHYVLEIYTGAQIQPSVMNACWAILRASTNWEAYLSAIVKWKGENAILYAEPTEMDVEEASTDKDNVKAHGTNQWVATWALTVGFKFITTALQGGT